MKIVSKNTKDTFCYHLENAPAKDLGDEALEIFNHLALSSLMEFSEMARDYLSQFTEVRYAYQDQAYGAFHISAHPLGHLNLCEQLTACTAAMIALFHGGFQPENLVLEHLIQETMFQMYSFHCAGETPDNRSLRSWGRLVSIILDDGTKLTYPGHEAETLWKAEIAEALFWDEDWQIFALSPRSIVEFRNDLKGFEGFEAKSLIPENRWNAAWSGGDDYCSWLKINWPIEIAARISPSRFGLGLGPSKVRRQGQKVGPGRQVGKAGFVYCISEQGGKKKIGKTSLSPESRLKALQTANPNPLRLCFAIQHENPDQVEREIHGDLKKFRSSGEWFDCEEAIVESAFRSVRHAKWVNL